VGHTDFFAFLLITTRTRAIINAIVTATTGKVAVDQSKDAGSVASVVVVGFWVDESVGVAIGADEVGVDVVSVFVGETVDDGAVVDEGCEVGVGVGGAGVGVGMGGGVPVGEPTVIKGLD
jgi:hypothetical protein